MAHALQNNGPHGASQMSERPTGDASHCQASVIANRLVPNRRHPNGDGWGQGTLEWPQLEGFAIRAEAERATRDAILRCLRQSVKENDCQ
jgi:hypothetical protein